jgi:hypothetical protein
MGEGITLTCPWCGEETDISFGSGNDEVKALVEKDVRNGLYGKKYQELLSNYPFPEGVFENESVLCCCPKCGNWHESWNMNFYRKDFEVQRDCVADYWNRKIVAANYYLNEDGDSRDQSIIYVYKIYKHYYPMCEKCGARMKMYHEISELPAGLKCKRCGREIDLIHNSVRFLWD